MRVPKSYYEFLDTMHTVYMDDNEYKAWSKMRDYVTELKENKVISLTPMEYDILRDLVSDHVDCLHELYELEAPNLEHHESLVSKLGFDPHWYKEQLEQQGDEEAPSIQSGLVTLDETTDKSKSG